MGQQRKASWIFGLGETKPKHFREMTKIAWRNRGKWGYAMRILQDGVCDGCALGTSGMSDWTIDGTHLCLVRLNLLELNTMGPLDPHDLAVVKGLPKRAKDLREMGRLPYPMRRRAGEQGFTRISWDDVNKELGAKLGEADPNRIALYMTSRGIGNEVYFVAQKAWRYLGSPHVDNAARLCHSPSTSAMKATMGVAASTCSYRDWYDAEVIVFWGSNPANDQPVALKYLYEAKKRGAKVIVINTYREPGMEKYWIPSNVDSATFGTDIADAFVHVTSGGDLALAYAVQKILIESGDVDHAFIEARTEGWDEYAQHLRGMTVSELCDQAGATLADVKRLAGTLARAKTGVFVWSMGLTQHAHGSDTVAAVCCLGLSQGWVGREGCGLMPIRGHSGVQGGAEMGAYATVFPGGRPINEDNADLLKSIWGFSPPARVGLDTVSMLEAAAQGDLDVFYCVGGNFRDTLPDPHAVNVALQNVPVRVHQDIFLTPPMLLPAKEAVYLLPAKTRYEHEGGITETSTERRVIFSPKIDGPKVGEAREEWRIIADIAKSALPEKRAFIRYETAQDIREDIANAIPVYAEIRNLKKKGDAFQWGGRLLGDESDFPTPSGRARFVTAKVPTRRLAYGEFHLQTRRGKQFNSIVQNDFDSLTGADRDHVFMSAADMRRARLKHNDAVQVYNEYGSFTGRVFEAPMSDGNLQMFWPEANVLIPKGRVDPGGLVPDYNAVVKLAPAED